MERRQPTNEVFEDIKQAAIAVWQTYDNSYGYVDEKLERIEQINNYGDSWITFLGMFDLPNQERCVNNIKRKDTGEFLNEMREHYHYPKVDINNIRG